MRFGTAMSPFMTSAKFQTRSSLIAGAHHDQGGIEEPVGKEGFHPQQIFQAFFSVVCPADDGGVGEKDDAEGYDDSRPNFPVGRYRRRISSELKPRRRNARRR